MPAIVLKTWNNVTQNHKPYRELFKECLIIDNNFELIKLFLQHDPYLYKSKYITKK